MSVGSGLLFCESCGNANPCGCWQKMFLDSLASNLMVSTGCAMNWRRRATKSARALWVPNMSERPTSGTDCSSWPTPTAGNPNDGESVENLMERREALKAKGINGAGMPLGIAAKLSAWPTPRAEDSEQTGSHDGTPDTLTSAARLWQTPTAMLGEVGAASRAGARKGELLIGGQVRQDDRNANGNGRGSLNSQWVAQLMGLPYDWLDLPTETLCKLLATRSARK